MSKPEPASIFVALLVLAIGVCIGGAVWEKVTKVSSPPPEYRLAESIKELNGNLVRMIEILDTIQ